MKKIMIFWAVRMKKHAMFLFSILSVFFAVSSYAAEFKEPVLLWEREFDPPVREISDQNSNGDFLAIQEEKEKGSGRILKQKLLVIDSKGNIKREELLPARHKRTIPADQLWLTALSEKELGQLKKAAKPKQVDTWGENMYVSGNGEYYAVVTRGIGTWYEIEYKDKDGKSIWKAYPKSNYGYWKAYLSYDGSRIVVIDMGGLGGGDEWEVLGQRVYFYDSKGQLLKDYDFGGKMEEWLNAQVVRISKNGQYIGSLRGWERNIDSRAVLFNKNGDVSWDKKFWHKHGIGSVSNDGKILVNGYDLAGSDKGVYLINSDGAIVWRRAEKGMIRLSASGKYVIFETSIFIGKAKSGRIRSRGIVSVLDVVSDKVLYNVDTSELFPEQDIDSTVFVDLLENSKLYLSIAGYSFEQPPQRFLNVLFDVSAMKVLRKSEKSLGRFANDGRLTIGSGRKVIIYSVKGSK